MSILLVEDEPRLRRVLARALAAHGHGVDEAGSRAAAVAAAAARRYDVLLLDVNLPDASGWDVLRDLDLVGRAPPTVILSGAPPNPQRLRQFEPRAVLTKPFPIDALLRLVGKAAPPDPAR